MSVNLSLHLLLKAVADIAVTLSLHPRLRDGLAAIALPLAEATKVDRVNFFRVDLSRREATYLHTWTREGIIPLPSVHPGPFPFDNFNESTSLLLFGKVHFAVIDEMTGDDSRLNSAAGTKTYLTVPVLLDGQLWGMVNLDDCTAPRIWSSAEMDVLRGVAEAIAAAVRRERMEEERAEALASQREQLALNHASELDRYNQILNTAATTLLQNAGVSAYLEGIVRSLCEGFSADAAALYVFDRVAGALAPVAGYFRGVNSLYLDGSHPITPQKPLLNPIIPDSSITDSPHVIYLPDSEAILSPAIAAWHARLGHQTIISANIRLASHAVGVLAVACLDRRVLKDAESRLIMALTNQVAVALELDHLGRQARDSAVIDERNRMSRDIHDTVAQGLVGILMQTEAIRLSNPGAACQLDSYLSKIDHAASLGLFEARRAVAALRPASESVAPIESTLADLLAPLKVGGTIGFELTVNGVRTSPATNIDREFGFIARETIHNILKHAHATRVRIELTIGPSGALRLLISDNGRGFDASALRANNRYGILGMRERAALISADFELTSAPSQGTTLIITHPRLRSVAVGF